MFQFQIPLPLITRLILERNARDIAPRSEYFASTLGDPHNVFYPIPTDARNRQHGMANAHRHVRLQNNVSVLWIMTRMWVFLKLKSYAVYVAGDVVFAKFCFLSESTMYCVTSFTFHPAFTSSIALL